MAKDRWSAEDYRTNTGFVFSAQYSNPVLSLLDPQPGERIIDVGCGTGEVTVRLARLCGSVLGVDLSAKMIAAASKDLPDDLRDKLKYRVADAQQLDGIDEKFDAAFSNAALHWCPDQRAVFRGVRKLLKPGGRFVVEQGGAMNGLGVRAALHQALKRRGVDPVKHDPWTFPTCATQRAALEAEGFEVKSIELIARPTPLPTGLDRWIITFCTAFLDSLPESEREAVVREVCDEMAVDLLDDAGNWQMLYMRLRYEAVAIG